jgi:hypothetical protein
MTRALALSWLLALSACKGNSQSAAIEPASGKADSLAGAKEAPARPSAQKYGAAITNGPTAKLGELLKEPERYQASPIIVEGEVRRACNRKGCWMELATSHDPEAPGFRVTFKDYGFFVPTDSAGAHARIQGTVEIETIEASHVQHLEEEGARFEHKAADGTARETRFVATGVELERG